MKALFGVVLAAALAFLPSAHLAPAFAQAKKDPVASQALKKEFADFIAKFRAALKANDAAAVAALTKLPFMNDPATGDEAKFRSKIYPQFFTKKIRACLQRGKGVYDRDGDGHENFFIFCGESIFVFTKTPQGFLFTSIGAND